MSNSVLTKRSFTDSRSYGQPQNELKFKKKGNANYITFCKDIGVMIREGRYMYLEYQVNNITAEVFLTFHKNRCEGCLEIDLDTDSDNNARKFIIRSKCLLGWLAEDLHILQEETVLRISPNLSRTDDCLTYKVTKP